MIESDLQTAVFMWAKTLEPQSPQLKWLHAIPNGGKRGGREAASLKAQGVKPGILDIHLPVPRGPYHGLMIELKRPGATPLPSPDQAEYMAFLMDNNYRVACLSDFDMVKSLIVEYLAL